MKIVEGKILPLGMQKRGNRIHFSLQVEPGLSCTLKLFKSTQEEPFYTLDMPEDSRVKGIRSLTLIDIETDIMEYIYEIEDEVHVDPYALEVCGRKLWGNEKKEQIRCRIIEIKDEIIELDTPILEKDIIAYRLHVRGFTKHTSSKVKSKGCFKGISEKIPYLHDLGINQIQLLPSYEFIEEGLKLNYWGYAPGYYMAPKSAYCIGEDAVQEFGEMISVFHKNGFEVILDMPFVDAPNLIYQIECLRHYVLYYKIDGFILNPYTTNLEEVKKDPILGYVKVMTKQDDFQITMRKFLKGDEGMVKDVMWQLRKFSKPLDILTYNHITNHNGFTMSDLISYDSKHNEANGEKNQDGNEYNYCWNCGAEGPSRKKAVVELRKIQMRNAWTLLLLAQGTPCILAGDEFANSQKGNNNAYCQDNDISWLNWNALSRQKELYNFVKELIAFRKSHPVLHQGVELQGLDSKACGIPDVSYHGEEAWIVPDAISSRQLGVLYSGSHINDSDCYVAYNMHWIKHEFALPTPSKNKKWYQVLDTTTGSIGTEVLLKDQRVAMVPERSICLFISK